MFSSDQRAKLVGVSWANMGRLPNYEPRQE